MNWKDYINYLKEKIIEEREFDENKEEGQEETEEQTTYVWRWEAREKYSTSETTELMNTFEKIIESYENESYSSFSVNIRSSHHQLPEMKKLEGEKDVLKSWAEMFPKRAEAFFGKVDNETSPSVGVWQILDEIYEDWKEAGEKAEKLARKAKEWNLKMEELSKEFISQQAKKFLKQKGINILPQLNQWLEDYESLSEKEQKELKEPKEKIEEVKKFLEMKTSDSQDPKSDQSAIPWDNIIKYGGGGLLILIGIGLIYKIFKD